MKLKIIFNNNKCRIIGDKSIVFKLREKVKIKSPNSFWSPARRSGQWDGFVHFITEQTQMFSTGMLPQILELLKEMGVVVSVVDERNNLIPSKSITKLGDLTLRDYQLESYKSLLGNEIYGFPFQRGICYEATNSGKNLISAAIFKSFPKNEGLFIINNTEIFVQALDELEELLPGKIGQISSNKFNWKQYNICMVQTLGNRIKKYPNIRSMISKVPIVIVDEADEVINRKDCREIFSHLYNAPIRVAMTGTALLNKNPLKNQNLISFFGPVVHRTTNIDLIKKGYSAKPVIKFLYGMQSEMETSYPREYRNGIVKNYQRNRKIWNICKKQIDQGKGPVVILVKIIQHIRMLKRVLPKEMDNLNIKYIHGSVKMNIRKKVIDNFRANKIDILVTSMILRRGKNLKTMNTLINAAGGDSESGTIQLLGRGLRKNETSDKVYVYEFYDHGKYLRRHSKHRIKYYKKEGFEVKELYGKILKKMVE
jgi:superfamily II DNA or RNA helicase